VQEVADRAVEMGCAGMLEVAVSEQGHWRTLRMAAMAVALAWGV
jgi:hypothetical protein